MCNVLRRLLTLWCLALVGAALSFTPVSAAAMIGCETAKAVAEAHHMPAHADGSAQHEANDQKSGDHCTAHSCFVALAGMQVLGSIDRAWLASGRPFATRPPDALAGPEGPRRPPRA